MNWMMLGLLVLALVDFQLDYAGWSDPTAADPAMTDNGGQVTIQEGGTPIPPR